jgi:hypothetical protein
LLYLAAVRTRACQPKQRQVPLDSADEGNASVYAVLLIRVRHEC